MRLSATPMDAYKRVHTGPNTRLGGVHCGKTILGYHVRMARLTNGTPNVPIKTCTNAYRAPVEVAMSTTVGTSEAAAAVVDSARNCEEDGRLRDLVTPYFLDATKASLHLDPILLPCHAVAPTGSDDGFGAHRTEG
jgi:hypothetical protein